ncbi:SMI1/KNR4 family protein [Pseudomonas syringae pv. atrofaciens]|uniref:SMI1/KNR4 family protein n=1 Tax=Pseudomonas syringae pv. atrofaciens TaxID=192087 RepID=A0AAD0IBL4_PSESX|nr:SMI1/KNR4 family protein [Pseudomonas syringae]AVX25571.1 SMI1/KNR4 family protein [Pseudomonas syringae pv. atrofaciens]
MFNIESLKEKYKAYYDLDSGSKETLESIEKELAIKLPLDFKQIAMFYNGGLLGGISHHAISSDTNPLNIVDETLRLRKSINLADDYIVLAEPAESIIVLDVSSVPAVIWCDAIDAENINTKKFSTPPDSWDSYASFFSYLLDREESGD